MAGPAKLQVFDIVTGILYMVVALLEFYVFLVASLVCPSSISVHFYL